MQQTWCKGGLLGEGRGVKTWGRDRGRQVGSRGMRTDRGGAEEEEREEPLMENRESELGWWEDCRTPGSRH